jgi:hypothetical protein
MEGLSNRLSAYSLADEELQPDAEPGETDKPDTDAED